jgi:hypothetical protein
MPVKLYNSVAMFVKNLQNSAQAGVWFAYHTFFYSEKVLYSLHLDNASTTGG